MGGGYYNEFYDIKIADNHKNETDYSHNLSYSTETHGNISISCKSISQPPKKMGYFLEKYSNFYKPVNTKEIKKSVEIIGLIYSSIDLLKMMYNELLKIKNSNKEWNIGIKIVANDATTEVIQYLKENNIPHIIFNNINKNEYYINRIYKAYNHAAFISQYDNVIFINSDMIFGNNWFANLVKHHDGINIPVSRLIEYGNLNTCSWCLLSKCGNIFDHEINYKKFYNLEKLISTNKVLYTGIYMPVIFEKHRFIESGGYPNGNVNIRGNITKNNKQIYKTGDRWFFENILFEKFGMNHITVCDSICYHIQEGEIRSKNKLD